MNLQIKKGSENYCATIVQIDNIHDIPNADKIARTVIFGTNVIIDKDIKIGDKMIYFNSGTKLNPDFCKYNNLLTDPEQNKDKKAGYISHKQFRVKAIKLRDVISDGILLPLDSLKGIKEGKDWENALQVGDAFTTWNGVDLCEKYIIQVRNSNPGGKASKQVKKISRLVDNQFYLHNDTDNLRKNIHKINPNDIIGIHYKKHGTSAVFANIPVKRILSWYERLLIWLGVNISTTIYDVVYSSRTVIKNQYLNPESKVGYYGEDIWGVVAKEIGHLIPRNWTLYGEIIGYLPSGGAIQSMSGKVFDYGCQIGEHKFYVYKISIVNPDGKVIYLTDKQIEEYCEKVGLLYKDTFIYYGKAYEWLMERFANIYSDNENWGAYFLEQLEKEYNEKDCYMCTNKAPEEGIVVRVEKLESYEAYKLKSKRFILGESDAQEKDEIDIESLQ